MRNRPIGIGVQGLADAFILMRMPFDSEEAQQLNRDIFETIYYWALRESLELAKVDGHYETFPGSPASKGIFQQDMWNVTPSDRWDWAGLREEVKTHGIRNSLLLAPMPTASTAQILGNNESFEPYTSNIYTRRVLSGDFQVVNQHLLKDLSERGLWSDDLKNEIVSNNGSIQRIDEIPDDLKQLYRTVWEISQKSLINMSADRGAYIDQSQSLNIHLAEPTYGKLSSMHFYAWKRGLKTGLYYLRTRPAADPIKFTVDKTKLKQTNANKTFNDKENQKQVLKTNAPLTNGAPVADKLITDKKTLVETMAVVNKVAVTEPVAEVNEKDLTTNDDLMEQLKLACSLKNKDACTMCSS